MSKQYYGMPIRAYISMLVDHQVEMTQAVRRIKEKFIKENVPDDASGEVYRVASRFAVVAAAGESAEEITGWHQDATQKTDDEGNVIHEKVINRAGFKQIDANGDVEYLIFPEVYRWELCKGYDSTEVAKALVERGYMVKEAGDKYSIRRTLPEIRRRRVYAIRAAILEGD
jgi:putative DNA primase/helicase